jgi:hypothetical protein
MFWRRRKSRIEIVEEQLLEAIRRSDATAERLDRVAIRQVVSEVMLATTVGFILRSVGEDILNRLMNELRKNISATATNEAVALELEERASHLLDQIESLARLPHPTDGTRH